MEDSAIIDLYWAREERAISETDTKYGSYCRSIARNILSLAEDAEECVSDTWLHAWNAMPPQRPSVLSSFLGRITRNLALDRCRILRAEKRGGGSTEACLDELAECLAAPSATEQEAELRELTDIINGFLGSLPQRERTVFLRRYWFMDSVQSISQRYGMNENTVKSVLRRTREKLRTCLKKEEYAI